MKPRFRRRELRLAWAASAILWWFEGQALDLHGQLSGERVSLDTLRQALKPYQGVIEPLAARNVQEE